MLAADSRRAHVIGTWIDIGTVRRRTAHTSSRRAGIRRRAGAAVIARGDVVGEHTSTGRITAVVGADVPVVTDRWSPSDTDTGCTGLGGGASAAVVT